MKDNKGIDDYLVSLSNQNDINLDQQFKHRLFNLTVD